MAKVLIIRNDFSKLHTAGEVKLTSSRFVGGDAARNLLITKDNVSTREAKASFEERLSDVATGMAPIGTVMAFAGPKEKIPEGWRECNGGAVSSKTFPALYLVIQNYWGAGDGQLDEFRNQKDFNLPDLRGRFLRGVDGGANIDKGVNERQENGKGDKGGVGSRQEYATALPRNPFVTGGQSNPHSHPISHNVQMEGSGPNQASRGRDIGFRKPASISSGANDQDHHHTVSSGGDSETRPANSYVYYIIRVGVYLPK